MKLVNSKLSELMLTESSLRGTEFLKRSSGTETEQCLKQGENNKEVSILNCTIVWYLFMNQCI